MKKLLIDIFPLKVERSQLTESISKNGGRMIIPNMILQRADVPNKNKRVYHRAILEREVNRCMQSVRESGSRGLLGELDHDETSVINLKNVALGVLDTRWSGNDLLGDVEVLNTTAGNILREIILAGYVPGISSRGLGSVEQLRESDDPEVVEVMDDFSLLCWDAVSDPSTHNAYFKTVAPSFSNTIQENTILQTKTNKIDSLIRDIICELSTGCCLKN